MNSRQREIKETREESEALESSTTLLKETIDEDGSNHEEVKDIL